MTKKKAYVVGTNVSASLSPAIFQYWFKKYNIDAEYGYIELNEKKFDKKIKSILNEEGLVGLNITMPFKEKIITYLPQQLLSPEARKIGAVNWIWKTLVGEWRGHNSDWSGFQQSIKKNHIKKKTAIVIGYGGAAKAIIYTLGNWLQFKKIKLFTRNFEKTEKNRKKSPNHQYIIEKYNTEDLKKHTGSAGLIINTTPINILNSSKKWIINHDTVGFDVVYRPRGGTGFLNNFMPSKRIEGIHMLAHQAAPCFCAWFKEDGIEPEVDEGLLKALYKKMEEK